MADDTFNKIDDIKLTKLQPPSSIYMGVYSACGQ